MTSNYFRQYIAGGYPARRRVAFASALELLFADLSPHTFSVCFHDRNSLKCLCFQEIKYWQYTVDLLDGNGPNGLKHDIINYFIHIIMLLLRKLMKKSQMSRNL